MKTLTLILALLGQFICLAQYSYEVSAENPFGKLNPEAPPQTGDFAELIGTCECKSVTRIDQNNWADTVSMSWTFKYIMNGWAVQDETLKEDGGHSGSIRQYNSDSSSWYVHYYASTTPTTTLSSWEGNREAEGNMVLYRDQKAPNGWDGDYRLTFSDISESGFNWAGEWVSKDRTIIYPTWRIFCEKVQDD